MTAVEIIRCRNRKPIVIGPDGRAYLCGAVFLAHMVARQLGVDPAPQRWVDERAYRALKARAE